MILVQVHFHDRPGVSWQPLAAVFLLVALAALATFQYRWLGEVSDAERERMRTSLRARASEFTQQFDAELTRTFLAFHVDGDRLDLDPAGVLAAAYKDWQTSTTTPGLVSALYLAEGRTFESAKVQQFDVARGSLEPAVWPSTVSSLLRHAPRLLPQLPGLPPPMMMADAVDANVPALVVPVPHLTRSTLGGQTAVITQPNSEARVLVVVLDAERLKRQLLEPLVAKYFGEGESSEYFVTVVRRDDPSAVIFSSISAPVDKAGADITTGLFDLRLDQLTQTTGGGSLHDRVYVRDRVAITIVRRANAPDAKRILIAGTDQLGAWEVRARHRSGSLEAIVARSRRRNIGISLGVVGLLAASLLLALASVQRQRRLARQQMEFVAAVSHELRTPLAVICSAGENLADGVVFDRTQVKRYGTLIETEGRRLGDMVERVMAFAGISSGGAIRAKADVDMSKVVAEVAEVVRHDAQDRGVTVTVHPSVPLPPVVGDAAALRSAVQNIVGNAVKYSQQGGSVEVGTSVDTASPPRIQIRVVDRGLGIDAADLPHIFKPFFRGRRAVDAQVRGSGVGLSVVKHVVAVHQGTIAVDSRVGKGTTVVVELPTQTARPLAAVAAAASFDPTAE